ncbi:MAG: hypothetical protein WCE79_10430 [Xanthobacteraceae bacterium]
MPGIGFNEDIKPLFEPFVGCMKNIDIGTDEGVFTVDLGDYDTVKRLHEFILTAIRGHDPATETLNPMPPGGPLDKAEIDMFAQWISDGMPETRLIA